MKKIVFVLAFIAASLFWIERAEAAPTFGFQLGLGEYATLNPVAHGGVYPSVAVYAQIPVANGKVNLIPALGVEYNVDADGKQWGFVPSFTVDVPVHKKVGVGAMLMLMHNQNGGNWCSAEFLLGFGPELSVYVNDSWTVGVNAMVFRSLNMGNWALFPGVSASRSF